MIRVRKGQHVRIRFANNLDEPSIVHWHGLDVPEAADGHPRFAIPPRSEYVYEFQVVNRAGTYWYHPHPHGATGRQVYRGLAGLFLVSDDEEDALALPGGAADLPCVIQDRRLDARNQLVYAGDGMMGQMQGMLGERALVNGAEHPTWPLSTRTNRLRLLNGSSARVCKVAWHDGTPMTVIGSDGGLLEAPVAPAQRADVILDLSGRDVGSTVQLLSASFPSSDVSINDRMMGGMRGGMMGGMMSGGASAAVPNGAPLPLMTVRVARSEATPFRLPARLSTFDPSLAIGTSMPPRRIAFDFSAGQWRLGGRTFEMTGVARDEIVTAGARQIWEVAHVPGMMGMQMAHPLHVHGTQFRVLSREHGGSAAAENSVREGLVDVGWRDTVLILPGDVVRLQMRFTTYPGLYPYHCHILEHEDMGMMRNIRVTD